MSPPPVVIVAPAELMPWLQQGLAARYDHPTTVTWQPPGSTETDPAALYLWVNLTLDEFFIRDARGLRGVDVVLAGEPTLATQLGWMVAAGGELSALNTVAPILDAWAPPMPWAWLHAGGPGAGAFAASLYLRWQQQQQSVINWLASDGGHADPRNAMQHFDPASWQALAQQQMSALQADASSYLEWADDRLYTPYHPRQPAWQMTMPPSTETNAASEPAQQLAQLLLAIPPMPTPP